MFQKIIDLVYKSEPDFKISNYPSILVPSKNLAIDINYAYIHSENHGKDGSFHLNRTIQFEKNGIQLLQFWDFELNNKPNVVLSIISTNLGLNERIPARKCVLHNVSKEYEKYFLDKYHLQGYTHSNKCIGLYKAGELLSLMSFRTPRYNKRFKWELLRYCTKEFVTVVGGASKIFKGRPEGPIISYSDRRYSVGKLYKTLGMYQMPTSGPNYFYTKDYKHFYPRIKFQKHKLSNQLEIFDPKRTEWQNMLDNGWDRIWDSGNLVFASEIINKRTIINNHEC